jgi:hypothetical protein
VPEFVLRFLAWILSRVMYKVTIYNEENLNYNNAAILAPNHVSFIDWLILYGVCKRPVRFVMYYKFFQQPLVRFWFKKAKVIPIAGFREDSKILNNAFLQIESELNNEQLICLFPEGQITHNGEINPLKQRICKVLEKQTVPVIPIYLRGLWGSVFSRSKHKAWRLKRRDVEIIVGDKILAKDFNLDRLKAFYETQKNSSLVNL